MLDQERVERDPVARVDPLAQGRFGLFRSSGPYDPEAVRDAVDVGVDRDRRDSEAEDENAVRGLRSDPGELEQRLHRPGHLAPVAVEEDASALADDPRFGVIETGGTDQALDGSPGRGGEVGRARVAREELRAGDIGRLVAGPLRQDRPDEDLEGVLGVVAKVGDPPVPAAVEFAQPVQDDLPREGRGRLHVGAPREGSRGRIVPGSERSGSSSNPGSCARRSSPTR